MTTPKKVVQVLYRFFWPRPMNARAFMKLLLALGLAAQPLSLAAADGLADLVQKADATESLGTAPQPNRIPVPTADALRRSASKVNEVFGADAKGATSAEAKAKLAVDLLGHAAETTDPTDCYVLIDASRGLAAESGDIDTALEAIKRLAARYVVDGDDLRITTLEIAATKSPPTAAGKIVSALVGVAADQKEARDLASAEKTLQLAATAARRAKDRDAQKLVVDELSDIRERRKLAARLQPLIDAVAADPSDREASTGLGRFRCFIEDDWRAGLALLARGSDADLATLAKAELVSNSSAANHLQLADRWWEYAAAKKGPDAAPAESRARMHYGMALGDLDGLEKARVQKRLETTVSGGKAAAKRPKDLVLCLDASAPGALRGPDGLAFDKSQMNEMPVAEWIDVGKPRLIARQKNPAMLPSLRAGAFGKLPGVSFNGKSLLLVDAPPPEAATIAVVFRVTNARSVMCVVGGPSEQPGTRLESRETGALRFVVYQSPSLADFCQTPDNLLKDSRSSMVTATWPNPFALRVNGQPFPGKAPPRFEASEGTALVIGAMDEKALYPLIGDIGELRIYSRALNPGEISAVETELAGKWGVAR